MDTFTESQRFRQGWLWIITGFVVLMAGSSLLATDELATSAEWFNVLPPMLIVLLLYSWRLDTRLDSAGIHYRVFPVLAWRTIPWNVIQSVSVREYGFVGYGIRWSLNGWVYNVAGNKGLRIVFKNNRQITIGTQRPAELQQFLEQQPVLSN